MSKFLWTFIALGVLEIVVTVWNLARNKVPCRTAEGMAINAILFVGLVAWALTLVGGAT